MVNCAGHSSASKAFGTRKGLGIETSAIRQSDYIIRDIRVVMQNIAELLPADVYEEHRISFEKLLESVFYTAPEAMQIRWAELGQLVEDIVGAKPFETWHYKVIGELMAIDPKVALDIFG